MTTNQRKIKVIEDEFIQLDTIGDCVSGVLDNVSVQTVNRNTKPGEAPAQLGKYTLVLEAPYDDHPIGATVSFLGTPALDSMMQRVSVGDWFRVTYTANAKTGSGNQVKKWKLEIEDKS